jgi:hypothetical protein
MEMPKPTAEHKKLEKLAGIWKGTETMYPSGWDPKGGEAQAVTRSRVALDGFAVIGDYEQTRGGKTTFQGHAVYTWDANAKQVVLHWFDSTGQGVDEFRGGWTGDRLVLQCENAMGFWRMSWDHSKPGVVNSCMETSKDGKAWAKLFDGKYLRED